MAYGKILPQELLDILREEVKFPYDEPLWFLIKNIQGCLENNPQQIQKLYALCIQLFYGRWFWQQYWFNGYAGCIDAYRAFTKR